MPCSQADVDAYDRAARGYRLRDSRAPHNEHNLRRFGIEFGRDPS
jgi:hypothetical protein